MGTVYVFFADGFEEMEAFSAVDVMKRAGLQVEMVSVTPNEIVTAFRCFATRIQSIVISLMPNLF